MPTTYSNLHYHIVFSTKRRLPTIGPELRDRLYPYIGGIVRGRRGVPIEIGGTTDHVHLLVGGRTDETLAELLREIKSETSRWIHKTFPDLQSFAWQEGYGVFTVSQSQVKTVRAYIQRQEDHHRSRTFESEFEGLLRVHQIQHEPEELWKG